MVKLTLKQEDFCLAYVETGNASEAYRRAYDCSRWTDKSVNEKASVMLKHVKVVSRIAELRASHAKRHEITVDRIVEEYSKMAFSNMLDYVTVTKDGLACVDFSAMTRDQAAAILEIKVDRVKIIGGGQAKEGEPQIEKVTFRLADKKGSLDSLGKFLGMFIDRKEVGKPGEFAELEDMSDADLADIARGSSGRAVAPTNGAAWPSRVH